MRTINLYTTVGCHLCDEALALLQQAKTAGHELAICEVEISESESLMSAYGVRIPVVRFDDAEEELGWPFSYRELDAFLDAQARNR